MRNDILKSLDFCSGISPPPLPYPFIFALPRRPRYSLWNDEMTELDDDETKNI